MNEHVMTNGVTHFKKTSSSVVTPTPIESIANSDLFDSKVLKSSGNLGLLLAGRLYDMELSAASFREASATLDLTAAVINASFGMPMVVNESR